MADWQKIGIVERDVDQAITALKKGAHLLKYGRRGKPKFCPFRLSADESSLVWCDGKEEKQLELCQVSRIIPGQRTEIFQRYPRPEKEYQSFSLIYQDRSLDLICKDKDEAEVWFAGLKALITRGSFCKVRSEGRSDSISLDSPLVQRTSPSNAYFDHGDTPRTENFSQSRLGKAFADIVTYTAATKAFIPDESAASAFSQATSVSLDVPNGRISAADAFRISLSSVVSSSSQGSGHEYFDALGDIFIWGEGTGDGVLGGGMPGVDMLSNTNKDAYLPKVLESTTVLDVKSIACGRKHAVLVTKQGEIFSWGEESGGRLGHGVDSHVSHPKIIETLTGTNIEMIACGEYHSCAFTLSGDLYTWGDGAFNSGLLGHGSEVSHWIPKLVTSVIEDIHVSYVSCGPWHTAFITSVSQLFTFGDGTFGALGHGDCKSTSVPREVKGLNGLQTVKVCCGVWHTAAVVDVMSKSSYPRPSDGSFSGKLFTWGAGEKGQLGHGDKECKLVPECVAALIDENLCQVACGHSLTIALSTSGRVYSMGSNIYGQLGSPLADEYLPSRIEGKIADSSVEEIACGAHHVAILTSKLEVYTWGKGANGQLGHGDNDNRDVPTLVDFLKGKNVKNLVCGSNFTAAICRHKWVSSADNSVCSGCHNPFNFRRKRHNCYNCGLVFCKACSTRKSLKASLAPTANKPYRVCDDCFYKLQKAMDGGRIPKNRGSNILSKASDLEPGGCRSQGHLSRLSSADSFCQAENKISIPKMKAESNTSRGFPHENGNIQRGSHSFSKSPKHLLSVSIPNSKMVSWATSPVLGKTSPHQSATPSSPLPGITFTSDPIIDAPKSYNESLSQEVSHLRAQVEDLASKSQLLEAKLEKKSRKLKEATELAKYEAEKCKTAKEVIKSLTAQLKEMIEKVPEGDIPCSKSSTNAEHRSNDPGSTSNNSSLTSLISPKGESNLISSNGTKTQTERTEWVIQDEPGVYLTLSSSPGGGNELKRVRFSRKRFSEGQAEKWWNENGSRVCERHNVLIKE